MSNVLPYKNSDAVEEIWMKKRQLQEETNYLKQFALSVNLQQPSIHQNMESMHEKRWDGFKRDTIK
jgi:hypothetical protein